MSRSGIEPGPPRWEASAPAKSYSNSILIAIRNIIIWARDSLLKIFKVFSLYPLFTNPYPWIPNPRGTGETFLDPPHTIPQQNFARCLGVSPIVTKFLPENFCFRCSIQIQILIPNQIYSNLLVKHELGKVSRLKISAQNLPCCFTLMLTVWISAVFYNCIKQRDVDNC